jgi:Transposase and inactivated derivatives
MKRQYLPHTVSSKKLAIYLANKNYEKILSSDEIRIFERFKDNNPLLKELWDLSAGFRDIFEKRSVTIFHKWTDRVMHSPFNSLKRFVKRLYKDLQAVIAAIEKPDNNGITEGNVNRLKNIKRQMYGRAGFELLRRKVVLSSTG